MMDPAHIVALFNAPVGGREANDANNKTREHTVVNIINNPAQFTDPLFAPLIHELTSWISAKKVQLGIPADAPVQVRQRGGRRFNWDFDLTLDQTTIKVEFKFGATSVKDLPEFFNPAANYEFHPGESYARFFFQNFLQQVCAIYNIPHTMTEADYVKRVHGTSKTPPLFQALYDAENAGTAEQKFAKKVLVDQSIAQWLELVAPRTDLAAITRSFQASQAGKHFMLCKDGLFYSDAIHPDELIATGTPAVRLGKYLVIQSAKPGTTHEMLLRWKNHAGILYPAWQISMKRT
jgi:hypothetical protein